jgi:hypothetical protein
MVRGVWLSIGMLIAMSVLAQGTAKTDADKAKEDIATHRVIAQAHENAAKCLEQGKGEKVCHEQLARECKGVAIGKHCGMRHKH